ncbi:MAG: hypothetical protein E5X41_14910 [Mesorhizobium sp.]|nr:MAG: hypothetical protein E5X41_14910 [Mesorhizobium sp.]
MAYQPNIVPADGVVTDFSVTFPYLTKGHVKVLVDGAVTAFTWITPGIVRVSPAPAAGKTVTVLRETPSELYAKLKDGVPVPADTYNSLTSQAIYVAEEGSYKADATDEQVAAAAEYREQTEDLKNDTQSIKEAVEATADEVTNTATAAAASATAAAGSAAQALVTVGGVIYDTTAAGIAATTDGQFFVVKGDGTTTYVQMYKNVAGVATLVASLASKVALDALLAMFTQPTNPFYDFIVEDALKRIGLAIRKDGKALLPKAEVTYLRSREATLRRAEAGLVEFRATTSSDLEDASIEAVDDGNPSFGLGDATGRQALVMTPGRLSVPAVIRDIERHSRGRTCSSDTHYVARRRRVATSSSPNCDLFSIEKATGKVVRLTNDVSNYWDFCEPAIMGTDCIYVRRAGGIEREFVVPLAGGTAKPLFPDKFLVTNGDSLVNTAFVNKTAQLTGLPVVDISLGSTSFVQQVAHLAAKPHLCSGIYCHWEGGINPEANIPGNVIAPINTIVGMLTPYFKRWLIGQPMPGILRLGDPGRQVGNPAHYDAQVAAIAAAFPNNYVSILPTLQAANNGSAQDLADVAGDAVPSSLMANPPTDAIHLADAGNEIAAGVFVNKLTEKGWII